MDDILIAAVKVRNLRQQFFASVFPKFVAQHDFRRHFLTPDILASPFPPVFCGVRGFKSLLVKALKIATLYAIQLHSYWKQVLTHCYLSQSTGNQNETLIDLHR
jgi:hypothetical protein